MSCTETIGRNNSLIEELLEHALQYHFKHRWDDDYDGSQVQSGHYDVRIEESIGGIIEINIKGLIKESEIESYYVD